MENNKDYSGRYDGLCVIVGFIGMACILFFVAFFMGREIGKNDKGEWEEFTGNWENTTEETTGQLEAIEGRMGSLEMQIEELEKKLDAMQVENKEPEGEETSESASDSDAAPMDGGE